MKWYNFRNGGHVPIKGYASGGIVDDYTYDAGFGEQSAVEYDAGPGIVPGTNLQGSYAPDTLDYGANAADDLTFTHDQLNPELTSTSIGYNPIDAGGSDLATSGGVADIIPDWQHHTFTGETNDPGDIWWGDDATPWFGADGTGVGQHLLTDAEINNTFTAGANTHGVGTESGVGLPGGGTVPVSQPIPYGGIGSYLSGPGGVGVNTGIPQGGHAANAIAAYLSGANAPQYNQQISDQLGAEAAWGGVDHDALDAYKEDQAAQAQVYASDGHNANQDPAASGTILTDSGQEIHYDGPGEYESAQNIANVINEGGINPETGDPWISSGPNVLSAADEGLFGLGADYNDEFVENYDANYEHAQNNPTGQTTGNPLYDQGYAEVGGLADTLINNSTIGLIGNAITGENLLPTYDDLLPPAAAFNNDDHDDHNNDGDPTNDTGNAGWGFTSIADMFDGGGPGQSGDSYSGGIHGDNTVGDTSEGVGSIFDDWTGGSDDSGSDDSGGDSGGGGGGYSCYVATALNEHGYWTMQKKLRLLSWCIRSKPEGKLDTKLWRNGYCWFGKEIIAPRVGHPLIRWLSDGFYESVVEKRVTVKSMLGLAFFYIPSYKMGVWKMLRGKLEEIDRT